MDGITQTELDPATDERFVSLRRALGVEGFGINQILLGPGQVGRIHRHREQEEVYLVIAGTLTVFLGEDEAVDVSTGGLLRAAPAARRQLANRGAEACLLVALGASGDHVGRDGEAFASWTDAEPRAPQDLPLPADIPHA